MYRRTPDTRTQQALTTLNEMTAQHGYREKKHYESHSPPAEDQAAMSAAAAFVDEIIAQAEPLHMAGNHTGIIAALLEANSWMSHLLELENQQEEPVNHQNNETQPHRAAMDRALRRLVDATHRYQESTDHSAEVDQPLLQLWRDNLAPSAFAAMMDHHLKTLEETHDPKEAQAHNLATYEMADNIERQMQDLQESAAIKTTGPRPSRRQVTRCLHAAQNALARFRNSADLLHRTAPIRIASPAQEPPEEHEIALQLAQELQQTQQDNFAIHLRIDRPDLTLLAYRSEPFIRVKQIAGHYELEDDPEMPQGHAEVFLQLNDHVLHHHGPEAAAEHLRVATLVRNNAVADLYDIHRDDFTRFINAMRNINDDSLATRYAASDAVLHGVSGVDLLLEHAGPSGNRPTDQQARTVINSARVAGLSEGQLRALCQALEADPEQMEVAPARAGAQEILEALEKCPELLDAHQAITVITALGGDQHDPQFQDWIDENCTDDDQEDWDY